MLTIKLIVGIIGGFGFALLIVILLVLICTRRYKHRQIRSKL